MNTRLFLLATIGWAAIAGQQAFGQAGSTEPDTFPFQLLKWSEADQTSWIEETLDEGVPANLAPGLTTLMLGKSSLALPLVEQRIERVLRSKSPSDCFSDKSINPEKFVVVNAIMIAYAGNDEAMRQVAKLIKLDEKRFDDLVVRVLMATENRGNPENRGDPYIVAYHALELGEPLVDKRVYAWVQAGLAEKEATRIRDLRKFWAEAMVDRYDGVPTEGQWAADPFVSRLNPLDELELHKALIGYAAEVVERRAKR